MSIMDNSIVSTCLSKNILKRYTWLLQLFIIYNTSFIINWGRGGNLHADIYSENFSFRHVEKNSLFQRLFNNYYGIYEAQETDAFRTQENIYNKEQLI